MEEIFLEAFVRDGWKRGSISKKRLREHLDYYEAYRLAHSLDIQLKALAQNMKRSFTFLTTDDIRDIGSGWYLINVDNLNRTEPIRRNKITIVKMDKRVKEAPELTQDLLLPYETHVSCIYYHIGKILVKLLNTGDDLEVLYGSPLYFTIKRALEPDPTKRHLLIV